MSGFSGVQITPSPQGIDPARARILADREGRITGVEDPNRNISPASGEPLQEGRSLTPDDVSANPITEDRPEGALFINPFDFVEGDEVTQADLDDLQERFPDAEINFDRSTDASFDAPFTKTNLFRPNDPDNIDTDPDELFADFSEEPEERALEDEGASDIPPVEEVEEEPLEDIAEEESEIEEGKRKQRRARSAGRTGIVDREPVLLEEEDDPLTRKKELLA